jgi:hypothetical protein
MYSLLEPRKTGEKKVKKNMNMARSSFCMCAYIGLEKKRYIFTQNKKKKYEKTK